MKNMSMEKLYTDVGGKLMSFAKILGGVHLVLAALAFVFGFFTMFDDEELAFILMLSAVAIVVSGVITSWFIYAFGQIVNDVHSMKVKLSTGKADSDLVLPKL